VLVDSEPICNELDRQMLAALGWHLTEQEIIERFVGRADEDCVRDIESHLGRSMTASWLCERHRRYRDAFADRLLPVDGVQYALDKIPAATCVASGSSPERPIHVEPDGPVEPIRGSNLHGVGCGKGEARSRSVPPCGAHPRVRTGAVRCGRRQPGRSPGGTGCRNGGARLSSRVIRGLSAQGSTRHTVRRHARPSRSCCAPEVSTHPKRSAIMVAPDVVSDPLKPRPRW
jgi:hypothetical protein